MPELGLGIALKCDDGQGRAAEVAVAAVLSKLFAGDGAVQAALADLVRPVLKNWNGIHVGGLTADRLRWLELKGSRLADAVALDGQIGMAAGPSTARSPVAGSAQR